jgi:hypothetical protein
LSGGWILELGFGNFFTQSRKEERKAATAIGFWNLFFGISSIHDSRLTIAD